jgi:hypothetical protein
VSFFSTLYGGAPPNPSAPAAVVIPSNPTSAGVSNGFCYGDGSGYSPSEFASSGLACDSAISNGLAYADASQTDPNQVADAADSGPTSGDWMVGADGSIQPVSASSGPLDPGNPATQDESGSGLGASILSGLGSALGSLARGLGSGLGLSGPSGGMRASLPSTVSRGSLPPALASRFGGYGNNPYQRALPVPPALYGGGASPIAPIPGTPGAYSNQPLRGFGYPAGPMPTCGTAQPPNPYGYTPMYAAPPRFYSPALSPGYVGQVPSYGYQTY